MEFISEIDSNISFFDKFKSADGTVSALQVTLESNVGFQIVGADLRKKDLNKIDIGYFYPPLKAQSIKQVLSCPYDSSV
jgi:xanthine dehydrogenase molybdopterin-binding subunit B